MKIAAQAHTGWKVTGVLLTLGFIITACGPAATGPATAPIDGPPTLAKPLVIYGKVEPASLALRPFRQQGSAANVPKHAFNAGLARIDTRGMPQPELLAHLPELNTDSWRVFPDGTMQTTHTLRPNLTWHDGTALTADDFVFGWRIYSAPELGIADQRPMSAMSDLTATDREHFLIRWKRPYPEANTLSLASLELPALPQHILGPAFDQLGATGGDSVANHTFWGQQYVGLGPFRLQQWEPGAFIVATRFEGYSLGAAKIPRIEMRFSADDNVVVASLLAGDAHMAVDGSIGGNPETLTEQWERTRAGTIFQRPSSLRAVIFQLRPELANPRALLDLRVRRAIAHAMDKQAISDGAYDGRGIFADTPVFSGSAWGDALDDSVLTYPLDLRAAESLMNQAGFTKGADGIFTAAEGRPIFDLATNEGQDQVRELLVMGDRLRAAGLEIQQRVIPSAQASDPQVKGTAPALVLNTGNMGQNALESLGSGQIPTPANRWQGGNRGAWLAPEYDRLLNAFNTTLDRGERVGLVRQMLRIFSEDVPWVTLFFRADSIGYAAGVTGPTRAAPESNVAWNIHEWEFK